MALASSASHPQWCEQPAASVLPARTAERHSRYVSRSCAHRGALYLHPVVWSTTPYRLCLAVLVEYFRVLLLCLGSTTGSIVPMHALSPIGAGAKGVFLKVVKVSKGKQVRVRFPAEEAEAAVSWLSGDTVRCRLLHGELGGVSVVPVDEMDDRDQAALRATASQVDEAEDYELAREYLAYLATSCIVTLLYEPGEDRKPRYSLSLPVDARQLGLLPNPGQVAVIFGFGTRLEIWRQRDWLAHSSAVHARLGDARENLGGIAKRRAEELDEEDGD